MNHSHCWLCCSRIVHMGVIRASCGDILLRAPYIAAWMEDEHWTVDARQQATQWLQRHGEHIEKAKAQPFTATNSRLLSRASLNMAVLSSTATMEACLERIDNTCHYVATAIAAYEASATRKHQEHVYRTQASYWLAASREQVIQILQAITKG